MNFSPLLFIPLREQFGFSYTMLGLLVMINFITQVLADVVMGRPVDRHGFRPFIIIALLAGFIGLAAFAIMPRMFPGSAFAWLAAGTAMFSMGIGLLEILLSPIINSIPSDSSSAAMVRLHSFYAWGMLFAVAGTALGLFGFGTDNWHYIVLVWAALPLVALFFFIKAPMPRKIHESRLMKVGALIRSRVFILGFFTIFFGAAAELTLVSWLSSFFERGLGVAKLTGDLLGLGGFALFLGIARTVYGKLGKRLEVLNMMIGGAALAVACYLVIALSGVAWLSVIACCVAGIATALMWPGTLSAASSRMPVAGVLLFALLAAGGDIGTSVCSWLTGFLTDVFAGQSAAAASAEEYGLKMGMLVSALYPVMACVFACLLRRSDKNS